MQNVFPAVCIVALVGALLAVPEGLIAGEKPAPAEQTLVDFQTGFDPAKLALSDMKAALQKTAAGTLLRIQSGHKAAWPGVGFQPPQGSGAAGATPAPVWDLSKFDGIRFSVTNSGTKDVQINCRVDNHGADGQKFCNNVFVTVPAGATKDIRLQFSRASQGTLNLKLFGMNGYPPQMTPAKSGQGIDPAKITQVLVFLNNPTEDYQFDIGPVRATGAYVPVHLKSDLTEATFFPFIDEFGQFMQADWPGKTHSLEELKGHLTTEAADWKAHPAPVNFDSWGGWKDGPKLDASGFFRAEKKDGKWWLVDPDGRLFFSLGIDCVRASDDTPIDERATWFKDYPGELPEFKWFQGTAWAVVHGYYQGKKPRTFNFCLANLKRKYGDDADRQFGAAAQERLRSWGLNTIGAWSSNKIYELRKTPYTVILGFSGKPLEGSEGYWGQFRDVFDPSFEADLKKRVEQEKGKSAGDPWCLGYFIDNEIAWGDDLSLAIATLKSPATQAAKKVFVDDLKSHYTDIAKFNAAWNTTHADWDAVLASREVPAKDKLTDAAKADLGAFYTKSAETYFRVCRDTLKATAPKQLYLGCRFAWVNDRAAAAAAKYCDVVSYNLYSRSIADFKSNVGDRPLIVGEFHFGALDRGMFHTGLVPVQTQAERAALYKSYVEGALQHPQFVGVHWFQFMDEPTTGRTLDGENYQIGFLDTCDTPYAETVAAAREVSAAMYALRAGKVK